LKKLEYQFKTDQRKHYVKQQVANLCNMLSQEAVQADSIRKCPRRGLKLWTTGL